MKRPFLLLTLTIFVLLIAAGCGKQVFSGNRTGNQTQFIMDYTILNKTETHEMELREGTTVNVVIENTSGELDILVADTKGNEVYRADNATSGKFSFEIPKSWTYKFTVTGKKAKGNVSFRVAD